MRAIAQMVSYEMPLIVAALPVVMIVGSLSPRCDRRGAGRLHVRRRCRIGSCSRPGARRHSSLFFIAGLVESNRTPVRSSRRRIGNRRRTHDRILRLQIRDVFHGRILRHVRGQRHGGDAVPRRLASADGVLEFIPSYVWFFSKLSRAAVHVHLDSRHAAAPAGRSGDGIRVEIHAADGVRLRHRRCGLALWRARRGRLALVAARGGDGSISASRGRSTRARNWPTRTYRFAE